MTQLGSHLFETVSKRSSEYMRKLCITVVPAGNMEGQMYNAASRVGRSIYSCGRVGRQGEYIGMRLWVTHDRR